MNTININKMNMTKSLYDIAFEQGLNAFRKLSASDRKYADSRHFNPYNDGQPLNSEVSYQDLSSQFNDGWFEAQCELAQKQEDRFDEQF